jgi:hypothetical protein
MPPHVLAVLLEKRGDPVSGENVAKINLPVCMNVSLFVCLSIHLPILQSLFICPSVCLSVCPSVYVFLQYFWKNELILFQVTMSTQFICLFVCPYINLPILQSLFISPSVCSSVCPPVRLSVYMFLQYFRKHKEIWFKVTMLPQFICLSV